jgi:hypothetical protein
LGALTPQGREGSPVRAEGIRHLSVEATTGKEHGEVGRGGGRGVTIATGNSPGRAGVGRAAATTLRDRETKGSRKLGTRAPAGPRSAELGARAVPTHPRPKRRTASRASACALRPDQEPEPGEAPGRGRGDPPGTVQRWRGARSRDALCAAGGIGAGSALTWTRGRRGGPRHWGRRDPLRDVPPSTPYPTPATSQAAHRGSRGIACLGREGTQGGRG